jgi:S-DNA-T family DNA segregation ATPase FtsK/SpoIIIE
MSTQAVNGRGQIVYEGIPVEIQIYLSVTSEDALGYVRQLQEESEQMRNSFTGELPQRIPMVSRQLSFDEVEQREIFSQTKIGDELFIGLSQATTEPYIWKMREHPALIVSIDTDEQAAVLFQVILRQMKHPELRVVFVDSNGDFESYQEYFDEYLTDTSELKSRILEEASSPETPNTLYYFTDVEYAFQDMKFTEAEMKQLLRKNSHHLSFIFQAFNSYFTTGFDPIMRLLRSRAGAGLIGARLAEQKIVPVLKVSAREEFLQLNEMYGFMGRKYDKLRLPMEVSDEK